jgi:hypothetical protein
VLDISHEGQDRDLKVWSLTYPCVYLKGAQERLLHRAGFDNVAFFGSFDFQPYDLTTSDRLIAVATR